MEKAEADCKDAERRYHERRERLDHARAVLNYELARIGDKGTSGRFTGATVRDAAVQVIREAAPHPISALAVWDRIKAEGCAVRETKYPGRSLHAALIHAEGVERVEQAIYRWQNGPSPNRSEEGGRGNAQQGSLGISNE